MNWKKGNQINSVSLRRLLKSLGLQIPLTTIAFGYPCYSLAQNNLNFAHPSLPASVVGQSARYFGQIVSRKSGQSLHVKIVPEGKLGGGNKILSSLRKGTLELGTIPISIAGKYSKGLHALNTPFLLNGLADYSNFVSSQAMEKVLRDTEEKLKIKILGIIPQGQFQLFGRRPIRRLDDLKGIKIRQASSGVATQIMKQFGPIPIQMKFPNAYKAMQAGQIDMVSTSFSAAAYQKAFERSSYGARVNSHVAGSLITIGAARWWTPRGPQ